MYRLFFALALVLLAANASAVGYYCYDSYHTQAAQNQGQLTLSGGDCTTQQATNLENSWKAGNPTNTCNIFQTGSSVTNPASGAFSSVKQTTVTRKSSTGSTCATYTVFANACAPGYKPGLNASGFKTCVADAACSEGMYWNPANGQCQITDPNEPVNTCTDKQGDSFAMQSSLSDGEADSCYAGCQVDWLPSAFQFGDNKVWTGTFTGQQCTGGPSGNLPPMLPLDPDAPRNCIIDPNDPTGNNLCFNYTDAQQKCGYFNDVRVCTDSFPPSNCGYLNGKYICGTGSGSPLTSQMPTDEDGQDRFPDWIIEDNDTTNNNTTNNTWIWETNNWSGGINPSQTADTGEQLKLDGIAKESTLQGLKGVIEGMRDNPGPAYQMPGTDLEQWPTTVPENDNEEQVEDAFSWDPIQSTIDGMDLLSPSTNIPGMASSSCQSLTFGIADYEITFPGPEGCQRLEYLKTGLAWLFAIFAIMKIYELALGSNGK